MADTFTDNIRLRKPEIGVNTDAWASLLNTGLIQMLDDAIASETAVDVTAGNVVLTEANGVADEARAMFLRVIGTPGVTRTIDTSTGSKIYVIKNDSDSSVIIEPATGAIGVTVLAGRITMVYVEPTVGAYEVTTFGDYVAADATSLGTATAVFSGPPGAGVINTTVRYKVQGSLCYVNIAAFDARIVPGTVFTMLPAANWPAEIVPPYTFDTPIHVLEDVGGGDLDRISYLTVSNLATTPWEIFFTDGTAWTTGSDRQLEANLSFVYSLRPLS